MSVRRIPVDLTDLEMALTDHGGTEYFLDTETGEILQRMLEVALNGKGAFRRFKDVLPDFPEERNRWFQFRDARLHQRILEWLEENDLAPAREG